tara:strand:- start:1655 stop:2080 length:426 start_codon:yes stop_codon:yes gene_type:complete
MTFAAHLSTSNENSLEARVNNFRSAYAAYRDIQTSQSLHQQAQMQDTLGTKEELTEANTIIKSSLDMAAKDFSKGELQKAQKLGLISDLEAKSIDALTMGNDFTFSPTEQEIQENKSRIAEARAAMNANNKEKSKDKSRDI